MLNSLIFLGLLLGVCGYASLRGGAPERIGAALFFVGAFLTLAVVSGAGRRYTTVEFGVFAIDAVILVALLILAVRAERFWPLWVTALHFLGTAGHAVKLADPDVLRWGYAFALAMWSYPMLALLAIGTWNHQRRLKRNGADVSWSSSFARSTTTPAPPPTGSSRNSAA